MAGRSAASRLCNAGIAAAATSLSVFILQNPLAAENAMNASDLIATLKGSPPMVGGGGGSPAKEKEQQQQASGRAGGDAPRTTAAGFDPVALERGATALREINASAHARKVGWHFASNCVK